MSESWNTPRTTGAAPAGSRFPGRPAGGATPRERTPIAAHDTP
ncbi:hypothetical protein BPA30113_04123 [Burkholderia paludis]|uniref:Uncharacterized protein n=1 Tax=Burkholderia paludis TaxID=1506587 RepID=A0A6P2MYM2_9BURK|nr:hypothetical protein LMG30113_03685 [Burkholderia paludis]VWB88940.1 hypothetical protein BPA30113_04123 [Burkholderia paludis]